MGNSQTARGFYAMETLYNDRWYRSTIEARYAVLFDFLRLEWEYEPQPFMLPKGGAYLPDFRVRTCGRLSNCWACKHLARFGGNGSQADGWLYIEVKHNLFDADLSKVEEFAQYKDAIACGRFYGTDDYRWPYGVQLVAFGDEDMMLYYGVEQCEDGPWFGMDDGKLGVCFPDDNQNEYRLPPDAYFYAMNYRFDHRKAIGRIGGVE